jgi:hypothetical protein
MDTSTDVFSRYCGAFLNPIGVEVNVPICGENLLTSKQFVMYTVILDSDCTAPFTVEFRTDATSDNAGADNALQSFGRLSKISL